MSIKPKPCTSVVKPLQKFGAPVQSPGVNTQLKSPHKISGVGTVGTKGTISVLKKVSLSALYADPDGA
jgi:hypothetical protein